MNTKELNNILSDEDLDKVNGGRIYYDRDSVKFRFQPPYDYKVRCRAIRMSEEQIFVGTIIGTDIISSSSTNNPIYYPIYIVLPDGDEIAVRVPEQNMIRM